jgi:hypothetical protein
LLAKIPVVQLEAEIEKFVEPVTKRLPEKRLKKVISLAVITQDGACARTNQRRALDKFYGFYG